MTCDGICKQVEEGKWHLLPKLRTYNQTKNKKSRPKKWKLLSATALFKQDIKLPKCYLEISGIFENFSVFMEQVNYKSRHKRKKQSLCSQDNIK